MERNEVATGKRRDRIASFYDPWSRSVTEDVGFYVDEALASGGPVVELAVGTGRIAVPIARAGIDVIGVDSSPAMLAVARAAAGEGERAGRDDPVPTADDDGDPTGGCDPGRHPDDERDLPPAGGRGR